ncbi:MAG: TonB-dependent receptor [Cytophagaceae bacterium]|nr:TonB-dependent receptor [Cytophagaceae bacterium]MDW8456421.1 TonB-dependent receptor [Cytophagaceae bacterium]
MYDNTIQAQVATIKGTVADSTDSTGIPNYTVYLKGTHFRTITNKEGQFYLQNIPFGRYVVVLHTSGCPRKEIPITVDTTELIFTPLYVNTPVRQVEDVMIDLENTAAGRDRLKSIEGTAIYEGKKTEVIQMKKVDANVATNNSRQIYAKVPGINIWESDAAGLQLGIGARGLDPNRTSNFNTRQNGYDMSADALGYPDAYYIPPAEAVEKIEVVRGAASLQYGPQFGGMINYVLNRGPLDKKIEFTNNNTIGSFGLFYTFNSIGGTLGKLNYYSFYQYKTGKGWRPNTQFDNHTTVTSLRYQLTKKISITSDLTYSYYLNQQPGGLTDSQFEKDPSVSLRERNWFTTTWRIASLSLDYIINDNNRINLRNWGFLGNRIALGFLGNINRIDIPTNNRDMIWDDYKNLGSEGRFLTKYRLLSSKKSSWLIGYRIYRGHAQKRQGNANNKTGPDFYFLNPDRLEGSDYRFPGLNFSLFSENIFYLSDQLTITPGIRYEFLHTEANGYFRQSFSNIFDTLRKDESRQRTRQLYLLGLGLSWKHHKNLDLYFNISQNFRGITFTDMRVVGISALVDDNLQDERGYNIDLGYRGDVRKWFMFDISVFYLAYKNRIGQINYVDDAYNIYRLTTNVGASESYGIEWFTEMNIFKLAEISERAGNLSVYATAAYVDARYTKSPYKNVIGKQLEFAPPFMLRCGLNYRYKKMSASLQTAYVADQYTDASNARFTPTAVNGIVPAYQVSDFSIKYMYKIYTAAAGINNIFNRIYFTRRAASYPGPGIIPAEPRTFYFSVGLKI